MAVGQPPKAEKPKVFYLKSKQTVSIPPSQERGYVAVLSETYNNKIARMRE